MGRRFLEIAKRYPKIGRYVHLYHPDKRGPMDVVEMLWGSGLFVDVFEHADLVHTLLDLVTSDRSVDFSNDDLAEAATACWLS